MLLPALIRTTAPEQNLPLCRRFRGHKGYDPPTRRCTPRTEQPSGTRTGPNTHSPTPRSIIHSPTPRSLAPKAAPARPIQSVPVLHRIDDWLRSTWVARTPLTDDGAGYHGGARRRRLGRGDRVAAAALWPACLLAVISVAWTTWRTAAFSTEDFSTVYQALRRFLAGQPVYTETYHHVDPHYLYNPGATVVLSPLGLIEDPSSARIFFFLANAAAIVAALVILTRLFGVSARSAMLPGAILGAFLTEAVRNTLLFGNINGVLLLLLTGFISCLTGRRPVWAGVWLGLAALIKPQFLPLVILPLLRLEFACIAPALAIPVLANVAGAVLMNRASDYLTVVAPYLSEPRDFANASLIGQALYFDMPSPLFALLWVSVAAAVAVSLVILSRWRYTDYLMWVSTSSAILLIGVFLLSSLGQQYYSMLAFPALFTVVQRTSIVHHPLAWAAVYLYLSPVAWQPPEGGFDIGTVIAQLIATVGWTLFLWVCAATTLSWYFSARHSTHQAPKRRRRPVPSRYPRRAAYLPREPMSAAPGVERAADGYRVRYGGTHDDTKRSRFTY